eukprot:jgi/Bigna1/58041/fgenesh1_pm.49_\
MLAASLVFILCASNPTNKRQEVLGFGGALTQAAAIQYQRLNSSAQKRVLDMYFSEQGLRYSLARVPMGSCDFSPVTYNFVNSTDLNITNFDRNLTMDGELGMLDFLTDANKAVSSQPAAPSLKVFGSPWSPPSWMKNGDHPMVGSKLPCLKDDANVHRAWALYFAEWISAYEKRTGADIWGVTAQNEPGFWNNNGWEACSYTAEQQRDFIRDHLGPVLEERFGKGDSKKAIMHYDFNKGGVESWAKTVLGDEVAAGYLWGTAVHWYDGDHFDQLASIYDDFGKSHHMLATEGCTCGYDFEQYPTEWDRAWRYAHDLIGDLNNGVEGWVDWNVLVDIDPEMDGRGGPNHAGNLCFAHVQVDNSTEPELVVRQSYYTFGQATRFLPRSSVILDHSLRTVSKDSIDGLAAARPDGSLVVLLLNGGQEQRRVFVGVEGEADGVYVDLEARSMATVELH